MAEVVVNTIIKFKRGNSADWTAKNILLEAGEPGYELDTGKLKVGNGATRWNDLKYVDGGAIDVDVDNLSIKIDGVGRIALAGFPEAQAGYSVRKTAGGALEWFEPATAIELVNANRVIASLQNIVGDDKSGLIYSVSSLDSQMQTVNSRLDNVYTKAEADVKISETVAQQLADAGLTLEKVDSVDDIDVSAADTNKHIYLVPKEEEPDDVYDEYIVVNGNLERIGSTKVDMAGYVTKIDFDVIKEKVNSLPTVIISGVTSVLANDDGIVVSLKAQELGADGKYADGEAEEIPIPVATTTRPGLLSKTDKEKLDKIDPDAQNAVTGAQIGGEEAQVENYKIVVPLASDEKAGVIKSSDGMNHVQVNEDGTSHVPKVGVNSLENVEGTTLVLCAGGAEFID